MQKPYKPNLNLSQKGVPMPLRYDVDDMPYEDIAEGYYLLNTNYGNEPADHNDMVNHKKAAAFFSPWKYKIERLSKNDVVFLYQSGVGIVAYGEASGQLEKHPYRGNDAHMDEEYSMRLRNFQKVDPPLTASEIKNITGVHYSFRSTMVGFDFEDGKKIKESLAARIST